MFKVRNCTPGAAPPLPRLGVLGTISPFCRPLRKMRSLFALQAQAGRRTVVAAPAVVVTARAASSSVARNVMAGPRRRWFQYRGEAAAEKARQCAMIACAGAQLPPALRPRLLVN